MEIIGETTLQRDRVIIHVKDGGTTSIHYLHESEAHELIRQTREGLGLLDRDISDELLEYVADHVHIFWAHWMKYLFSQTETTADDSEIIGSQNRERWMRQMHTAYHDLSEKEKESDRELAREMISQFKYDPFTGERITLS